jgi:hypothetical protein
MLRAAALLASVSLVLALPVSASEAVASKSVTLRILVVPVTRNVKDLPPKTFNLGEKSPGDTISGTSILRNAVRQFGKPKGARVGTSRFVEVWLTPKRLSIDAVGRLPGGTVHVHGVGSIETNRPKVPIVGGTGVYAGATGSVEGQVLPSGQQLDIYRLRVP